MTHSTKQAIVTLAIMLFIMGCLTVVTALASAEPARVVWLYFTVELFLLSGSFVLGWCVRDRMTVSSSNGKLGIKWLLGRLSPAGVGLVLAFLSLWNHGRSAMMNNLPELTGIERSFAKASFDVLTLFHLVVLTMILYALVRCLLALYTGGGRVDRNV